MYGTFSRHTGQSFEIDISLQNSLKHKLNTNFHVINGKLSFRLFYFVLFRFILFHFCNPRIISQAPAGEIDCSKNIHHLLILLQSNIYLESLTFEYPKNILNHSKVKILSFFTILSFVDIDGLTFDSSESFL